MVRLWWKSWHQPGYWQRLGERFGYYPFQLEKCLWIHAVSVGETLAARPLIKALQLRYPEQPILVTTMTPTGAERVKIMFGDSVTHAYLPYDLPRAVHRFLNTLHPKVAIIMETELWPNLIAACRQKQIPVLLVNARLSEKSAALYHRIGHLTREMLGNMAAIAAHGQADAERFIQLGASKECLTVTGNIKFDVELPQDLPRQITALRERLGNDRFIWIAASTHEGEEEMVLAAHKKIHSIHPQALLILVPRHPHRFDAIAKLSAQSFVTVRRSLEQACSPETAVYMGDTMGEMLLMYGVSDVAFVGGSLIPRGGHNILEPGALGKPILSGTHLFNFAEISELFVNANALIKVTDTETLTLRLMHLMQDASDRKEMGKNALQVVADNRGALARQKQIIERFITPLS